MRRTGIGPLLFIALPVLEILLTFWVASAIGWLWTLALLLIGFGAGLAVMRLAGMTAFRAMTEPMRRREGFEQVDPVTGERTVIYQNQEGTAEDSQAALKEMHSSGLLFAGGFLLAFPGFLTDLLGLVLALPPVRAVMADRWFRKLAADPRVVIRGETVIVDEQGVRTQRWGTGPTGPDVRPGGSGEVIQGEILPPKPRDAEDG